MHQRQLVAIVITADGRKVAVQLDGGDRPAGRLGSIVRRLRSLLVLRAR